MIKPLPEYPVWVDKIFQLEKDTPVLGGDNGPDNWQAQQLANRTLYLKTSLEEMPDYREYTFQVSPQDPDGTISGLAGTPDGKYFRVAQGVGEEISFIYYKNDKGAAKPVADLPGNASVSQLRTRVEQTDSLLLEGIAKATHAIQGVSDNQDNLNKDYVDQTQVNSMLLESASVQAKSINGVLDIIAGGDANKEQQESKTLEAIAALSKGLSQASPTVESVQEQVIQKSGALEAFSVLSYQLSKLNGFDPQSLNSIVKPTGEGVYIVGEPSGIIKITASMPSIPGKKEDPPVKGYANVDVDGQAISLPVMFSVQGASSAGYPKKNLSLEFYTSDNYADSAKVKIGSIIPHDTLVYKANWIDSTHAKNLLSYQLWDQVMMSRDALFPRDVDHSYDALSGVASFPTGALGHPTGWPCVVYINDEFYGIGTLLIGKKKENYNLPKNEPLKIFLGFDSWVNPGELVSKDESGTSSIVPGVELKYPTKPKQETYDAIERFSNAMASTTAEQLRAAMDGSLDLINMMDFHLFTSLIATTDLISWEGKMKNVIMISYDGGKFYFMPYDLDTVFGVGWAGNELYPKPDNMYVDAPYMKLLHSTYKAELEGRYKQLRNSGVFSVKNVYALAMSIMTKYSPDLVEMENSRWKTPSTNITSLRQMIEWLAARIEFLDKRFNYK